MVFFHSLFFELWFGVSYDFPTPENMIRRSQLVDDISCACGTESGSDGGDIKDAFHQYMTYKPEVLQV